MINRNIFDIQNKNKTEFNINPFGLTKSFSIHLNNKKIFSIAIYGFNLVDKFLFSLKNSYIITAIASMTLRANSSIESYVEILSNMRERIWSTSNLSDSFSISILLRYTGIILSSMSEIISLSPLNRVLVRDNTSISEIFSFSFSNVSRNYKKLSDYDGLLLSEMDGLLLRELDYEIVLLPLFDSDSKTLIDDDGFILKG